MGALNLQIIDTSTPTINQLRSYKFSSMRPYTINDLFTRDSQATLSINDQYRIIRPDQIRYYKPDAAYLIEPSSTNYFIQDHAILGQHVSPGGIESGVITYVVSNDDYVISSGDYVIIITDIPQDQVINLPSAGSYTLWVSGTASAIATPGTAIGLGFGTATSTNTLYLTITTPGTVSITIANASDSDIIQLESAPVPTTWIPNESPLTSTTRTQESLSINIGELSSIYRS